MEIWNSNIRIFSWKVHVWFVWKSINKRNLQKSWIKINFSEDALWHKFSIISDSFSKWRWLTSIIHFKTLYSNLMNKCTQQNFKLYSSQYFGKLENHVIDCQSCPCQYNLPLYTQGPTICLQSLNNRTSFTITWINYYIIAQGNSS